MSEVTSPEAVAVPAALSVKVTLRDLKPAIWRRIVVARTMTLGRLHDAIQAAMGWDDAHLHAFVIGDRQFGDPDQRLDGASDENRMTLDRLVRSGVSRFVYTYDFGDGWDHAVLIEKRAPKSEGLALPACVAGERGCPPEDCGGVWGYADLLDVLADPQHPERAERLAWLGGDAFDPEAFDIGTADAALKRVFAPAKGRRGVWLKA